MYSLKVGLCEKGYFWTEILEQTSFAVIHHTSSKPPVFHRLAFQTLCPTSLFFMCSFSPIGGVSVFAALVLDGQLQ